MRHHAAGELRASRSAACAVLTEACQPRAETLLTTHSNLLARFERVTALEQADARTRSSQQLATSVGVHRTEENIDRFSLLRGRAGPARSPERREGKSPLKFIAGCYVHSAPPLFAALFAFTVHSSTPNLTLEGWGNKWDAWVSNAFFAEYLGTMSTVWS